MIVGFHPVADNPIRMGYLPGWSCINDLIERLGDLEHAVGQGRVVPAPWEPWYQVSPSFRYAGAYAWARSQLQTPAHFAMSLAFFPVEDKQPAARIDHANRLILCANGEQSQVTRKLMLAEALELWEGLSTDWLEQVVKTCTGLGVEISLPSLQQKVQQALQPLAKEVSLEADSLAAQNPLTSVRNAQGFDPALMQMDAWTPDPGFRMLPVDGHIHSLAREILVLDLGKIMLLRARRSVRTVVWEKVTLVHLSDGAVILEVTDEPPLAVVGYKHPEQILRTVQVCHKAATERILQTLAARVTRPNP